jgi:hypothetical protein
MSNTTSIFERFVIHLFVTNASTHQHRTTRLSFPVITHNQAASHTAGFVSIEASTFATAARAIDRAAMQRMRAARLHDEERELERRSQLVTAAPLTATTPPATAFTPPALGSALAATESSFFDVAPPAITRAELQRVRAMRLHAEERELEQAGKRAFDGKATGGVVSRSRADSMVDAAVASAYSYAASYAAAAAEHEVTDDADGSFTTALVSPVRSGLLLVPPPYTPAPHTSASGSDTAGVPVVGPVGSVFAFDLPNRSQLNRLRAMRVHDEERDLEATSQAKSAATAAAAAAALQCARDGIGGGASMWGTVSGGGAAWMADSRMRRDMQSMRARRLHDEERELEAAEKALSSGLVARSMLTSCLTPVC